MPEQPRAKLDIDPVGGMREDIGAQRRQQALENGNDHQADDDDIERGQAAMHQHLVDDDLKEQRRDKRKKLEEERGDQHFAKQPAVFDAWPAGTR